MKDRKYLLYVPICMCVRNESWDVETGTLQYLIFTHFYTFHFVKKVRHFIVVLLLSYCCCSCSYCFVFYFLCQIYFIQFIYVAAFGSFNTTAKDYLRVVGLRCQMPLYGDLRPSFLSFVMGMDDSDRPINSLILSLEMRCLPLWRPPPTVPCSIVWFPQCIVLCWQTCPNHDNL